MDSAEKDKFHQPRCWNSILNCFPSPFIFLSDSLNACPISRLWTTSCRDTNLATTRSSTATPALAQSHQQAVSVKSSRTDSSLESQPHGLKSSAAVGMPELHRLWAGAHCSLSSLDVVFRTETVQPKVQSSFLYRSIYPLCRRLEGAALVFPTFF